MDWHVKRLDGRIVTACPGFVPEMAEEPILADDPELLVFLNPPESPFKPIDPAPFWQAAKDLLGIKKSDVLDAIADADERYDAALSIYDRKRYLRDDPMVVKLAGLLGYPPSQMDSLWLYVQENYV